MKRLLAASALILVGCADLPDPVYSACHAIGSSDWRAWVERHASAQKRATLVVTGKVTVPTGGYSVSLARGPVQQLDPPVQQVLVRTDPPEGVATQAITVHDVRGEFPAQNGSGPVTIRCGDGTLAIISKVEAAVDAPA
jgi:hypothetical protein